MIGRASLLANALLIEINPRDVSVPARIGFFHPDIAAAFGRLMAVNGQRDPIKVRRTPKGDRPYELVTGRHRLGGAEIEGINVFAIEVDGHPEELAELESSENLDRRPLAPIENAMFVHALCKAAQERIAREHGNLKQQQLAVKARWDRVKAGETRVDQALQDESDDTADTMSAVYSWQDSAAAALGRDKRTIRRALKIYRLLVEPFPDLIEALSRHPVVGENAAQLKAIADIRDQSYRRQVIEQLLDDPELSAEGARVRVGIDAPAGAAPAPYQKHYDAIASGWSRLGLPERRRFLPTLVTMLTPDMKRELRDRLNEELGND